MPLKVNCTPASTRVAGIELKLAVALVNCSLCYFLLFIIGQTMEKLGDGVSAERFTNAARTQRHRNSPMPDVM